MSATGNIRFMAEWEPQEAVMLALPDAGTDWNYMLDRALMCYRGLVGALLRQSGLKVIVLVNSRAAGASVLGHLAHDRNVYLLETPFNDTWTRDYGPLASLADDGLKLLDFGFNGWGLKFASDRDNLVNSFLECCGVWQPDRFVSHRSFILEGGSVETDGRGTLLTTSRCLCSPNRNGGLSKPEAEDMLKRLLGVSHVLWLDNGALESDDTDSHIDTLARLCPDDTVLYCGAGENRRDSQYEELSAMAEELKGLRTLSGRPFNLVELPLPDAVFSSGGERLPATYCNYLVTPDVVFVPVYGCGPKDTLALQIIGAVYPDRKATGVDCRALVEQHGSLHCATMQLPPGSIDFEVLDKLCRK